MPKVIDLPTSTSMASSDYFVMESSGGGTKKITKANVEAVSSTTISTASGWSASENAVYKTGRVVWFVLWVQGTLASGWNTIGTLPTGYRPIKAFDSLQVDNGASSPAAQVKITTSGEIQIYKLSGSSTAFRLASTFISSN